MAQSDKAAVEMLESFIKKSQKLNGLRFTEEKFERIDGRLWHKAYDTKINYKPLKIYKKEIFPEDGVEVLYVEKSNDDKVLVFPNRFPWMTLSLDPHSNTLRTGTHHTLLNSGYSYQAYLIQHFLDNKKIDESISFFKDTIIGGIECKGIRILSTNFNIMELTLEKEISFFDFCKDRFVGEYMLMELNPNIINFEDTLMAGSVIKTPSSYAEEFRVYINPTDHLPVMVESYDHGVLYERYLFKDIHQVEAFKEGEFDVGFDEYGFK